MDSLSKIQTALPGGNTRRLQAQPRFSAVKPASLAKIASLLRVLALVGTLVGFFGIILFTCVAVASGLSLPATIFGICAFSALEFFSLRHLRRISPM